MTTWHRVLSAGELPEGRVTTVAAGHKSIALVHYDGQFSALDNHCPHQGGPLGEGSIENGLLRCPWHGFDYCPLDGKSPGFDDEAITYPLEVRDGEIFIGVADEEQHVETVADVMARTMVNWGVRHVFGMVGHSNLGLADALRRREQAGELEFIGIRHEGAAAFAASAYGKLTGRPAACLTIAGPGATNLLTGLWDAKVDRSPVLALTGQVDTQVLGAGAFQEVDLAGAFGTVAAWSQTVLSSSHHAELMTLACKNALLAPGPAHLIFPDEVQTLPAAGEQPGAPEGRIAPGAIAPPAESLDAALAATRRAKRPIVIVGHGARVQMEPIVALAERLGAPVITTFKAKGQIPDSHPLAAGVLGRSGTPVASWFMNESDLILVFGASFSNHTGIYAGKPIVQVDSDRMQLGKFHPVAVPVWGDAAVTAQLLLDGLPAQPGTEDQATQLRERWAIWRAEKASRERDDRGHGVSSAAVFAAMNRLTPEDAVIAVDVGNHAYSFGRYFEPSRQTVLMSGYLGSIGFGYPAAIGAAVAAPERKAVAVTGDGGFAQYMAEVTTAVKHKLDITHVLLNNGQLGKISKEQRAGEWDVWQTSLHNPDFAAFARNCGALGIRVTDAAELDAALGEAFAHRGPAMVEVMTDPELI
ncbi:MAG TPA: thiamine pyrophosphate-dependent enzyme [Solirubrobacteraceae bacterium]|jgi:thiamine pyrophosphate-dependent acetolactate synthase large subunit-like protein/nitrite reductase/ring-hydroxylating ferredoxin subunit|nr:thiamine pyrophosphate-dependent enzyme [Solirubrobacteraceae bacterium]